MSGSDSTAMSPRLDPKRPCTQMEMRLPQGSNLMHYGTLPLDFEGSHDIAVATGHSPSKHDHTVPFCTGPVGSPARVLW